MLLSLNWLCEEAIKLRNASYEFVFPEMCTINVFSATSILFARLVSFWILLPFFLCRSFYFAGFSFVLKYQWRHLVLLSNRVSYPGGNMFVICTSLGVIICSSLMTSRNHAVHYHKVAKPKDRIYRCFEDASTIAIMLCSFVHISKRAKEMKLPAGVEDSLY